jgi:flagellar motility protein MotE (MotC chaperone)
MGGVTAVTLAKAFAKRIAGGDDASRDELRMLRDELERQRAELDSVHDRLAQVDELHNRVEFAERMLAQAREKNMLPGGR